MDLSKSDFTENMAPPCHFCGRPIVRTEIKHENTPDGWHASGAVMLCPVGHRNPVEPLEE